MRLIDLKKEIPFKWRVQSTNEYGASCVAYIDARNVQDLLDEVCGANNWQVNYSEHKGNLFASIGINTGAGWVWKSDCGTESNVEKQKGEASDAFKRAAVMWGVGRFLYHKEIVKLPVKNNKQGKLTPYDKSTGNFIYGAEAISKACSQTLKVKEIPTPTRLTNSGYDYLKNRGNKAELESALKDRAMETEQREVLTAKLKTL